MCLHTIDAKLLIILIDDTLDINFMNDSQNFKYKK